MRNIMVVGNGFDLYHGKKTRYNDFLEFLNNVYDNVIVIDYPISCQASIVRNMNYTEIDRKTIAAIKNIYSSFGLEFGETSLDLYLLRLYHIAKINRNWIDIELDIKNYIHRLLSFLKMEDVEEFEKINSFNDVLNAESYSFEHKVLTDYSVSLFSDDNPDDDDNHLYHFNKEFLDTWNNVNIEKVIIQLEKELSCLSELLRYYLMYYEPNHREIEPVYQEFLEDIAPSKVINFNYTNTPQELYDISDDDVVYIHGSLEKGNIVLGYDDYDQSYDDCVFKKYYRRLINNTDVLDDKVLYYCHDGILEPQEYYFFGHSLDYSDEDYLRMIFKAANTVSVYYLDENDRKNKIVNIIRLLGKDNAISMIRNHSITFIPIPEYDG